MCHPSHLLSPFSSAVLGQVARNRVHSNVTSKRQHKTAGSESGVIILQTVIFTAVLNLLAFALAGMTLRAVQIEHLHHDQRQAYWLARSECRVLLSELQAGMSLVSFSQILPNNHKLTVTVTNSTPLSIVVIANVGSSSDAVQFTYNVTTNAVSSWIDNVQH